MIDSQSNSTFAKIYMLDERRFANEPVKSLLFSNRTTKRLQQAGIITIMDLLKMTPAKLMKIEGFGLGCLEEIRQRLSKLDDSRDSTTTVTPAILIIDEPSLPESTALTIGEKYEMNPEDYADVEIATPPFSARVSNLLRRNQIKTIAQLLQQTDDQLARLRNSGKICTAEINARLMELREEKKLKAQKFTPDERLLMVKGDFSFLNSVELSDSDNSFVLRCIEAHEALGAELSFACIETPEKILPILDMVREFVQRTTWQQELQAALGDIPHHRKSNQAVAYINTFTRHENERETLLALYPTSNAPLSAIANSNSLDLFSFSLALRFLTWCKYNLQDDISHLFSVLYPNERNQQVVQLRAQKKTLDQIGKQFGLTRERIRQIERKMQHSFNARQGRVKIISKINADKNNATIVTSADIAAYCPEHLQELLFLLQGCESSNFTYDKDLDVFIVGNDAIHERAMSFVEKLPDIIPSKNIPQFYQEAKDEYDLPQEMVDKAIAESYKLTGEVYHRTALSLANIYVEVIKDYYPDGIDAYNPVTIATFRQLIHDKYGAVKLPQNDRALSARIAGICILCGRGRYRIKKDHYIPKKLAQQICDYIEDSDMDIFMTNTLFAVFEKELLKHGVDNKYYLQGILHELYGDRFTFTRDYVSKDPSITSIYPSIVNFIWSSNYPVTKEQILEQFPGLPEIAISIATSDPEVLAYFGGTFLHADSLNISDEEKRYLDLVVQHIIADGGIHHTKEVYAVVNAEKPEIFTRNGALYPFSAGSILEYLLQNRYEFVRPFIAKKGTDIASPADRLHNFVNNHRMITVSEISEFIRETKINVPSLLDLIDECNDRFLLTDSDTLQIIENTGLDCETARSIESMILSEISSTIRINDLPCWGQLPTIKVPWTDWLLYSVLKKWGTKIDVAASYPQFRYAVPLVAPAGKMDTTRYSEAVKAVVDPEEDATVVVHDLDYIDDIIADFIDLDIEWRDEDEF